MSASTSQNPALIALNAYLAALFAGRRVRVIGIVALTLLAVVVVGHWVGWLDAYQLRSLRASLLGEALPVLAVLLAEFPARDGIARRTLLYHLLGPVPRPTLLLTRMAVTWSIISGSIAAAVFALALVGGDLQGTLSGELLAVALGAACYSTLFGLVHLLFKRGLFIGLGLIALVDYPLSQVPFSLRNLAPMSHVQALASATSVETFGLPLEAPVPSTAVAVTTLLTITLCCTLLSVWRFGRQDVGEIC